MILERNSIKCDNYILTFSNSYMLKIFLKHFEGTFPEKIDVENLNMYIADHNLNILKKVKNDFEFNIELKKHFILPCKTKNSKIIVINQFGNEIEVKEDIKGVKTIDTETLKEYYVDTSCHKWYLLKPVYRIYCSQNNIIHIKIYYTI